MDTGRDYAVPPLEALWWADDPAVFSTNQREHWKWTLLSFIPEWITAADVQAAQTKAVSKGTRLAQDVVIREISEGLSYQALHTGPFSDEGPVLEQLHQTLMPDNSYTFNGPHHEIYLSDMRRTAPEKLKTILRQPVRPQ